VNLLAQRPTWRTEGYLSICLAYVPWSIALQVITARPGNGLWEEYVQALSRVVGSSTILQARRSAVSSLDEADFSNYLIIPAAPWPWGRLSL
jgi:hypothetical protein